MQLPLDAKLISWNCSYRQTLLALVLFDGNLAAIEDKFCIRNVPTLGYQDAVWNYADIILLTIGIGFSYNFLPSSAPESECTVFKTNHH